MNTGRPKLLNRDAVLEIAAQTFWKFGYAQASVRSVAEESGAGLQSIYNEFGDKRGLYDAALDYYCRDQVEHQFGKLLECEPAIEGLRALFRFWVDFHGDPSTHGCLLAQTFADLEMIGGEQIKATAHMHFERQEKILRGALERAQAQGDIPPNRGTRELARTLIALMNGVATLGRAGVSRALLRDVARSARQLIGDLNFGENSSGE